MVSIDRERLVETASRLVEVPSFTGDEEAAARLMVELFESLGLQVQWQQVEEGRANALGTWPGTGGGKSTILNLLLRFYEPDGGSITIDGTEISTVSRNSLRDNLAFVGQDAFLFRGTIRENIALGRAQATEAEVVAAAKAAYAHEFITRFPAGYDTQVGENGKQLSGGQRQRVSVARALIRRSPIILLDEPTSFLDTETERLVQEALDRLSEGRTTIAIAHRLSTVRDADQIVVLDHGRIVESGRHEDLILAGGRYTALSARDRDFETLTA